MTIDEINALTVDQLQEMAGDSLSVTELEAFRDNLLAEEIKRQELAPRLDAIKDKKEAFHGIGLGIANYDLWEKVMLRDKPIEMEAIVAQMEVKKVEKDAEKQAKKDAKDARDAVIAAFKAKGSGHKVADLVEVVKAMLD